MLQHHPECPWRWSKSAKASLGNHHDGLPFHFWSVNSPGDVIAGSFQPTTLSTNGTRPSPQFASSCINLLVEPCSLGLGGCFGRGRERAPPIFCFKAMRPESKKDEREEKKIEIESLFFFLFRGGLHAVWRREGTGTIWRNCYVTKHWVPYVSPSGSSRVVSASSS